MCPAPKDQDLYKPSAYPPSETALLFLDYQNILVDMIQDADRKEKLIRSGQKLLATARKNNVAVVHCLTDVNLDPPPTNKVNENWDTVFKPMFAANMSLAAEFDAFAAIPGPRESTSLRAPGSRSVLVADGIVQHLRNKLGIKHLILGGIATSGAILGTATHGTDINFVVSIVEDACWDPNEQVHRDLIDTVLPSLAYISTVDEAVGYMTRK